MYPGDLDVRMVPVPTYMEIEAAKAAIMLCRELGLLDLNETLWLVPRQNVTDRNIIGPSQRMASGRLA